MTSSRNRRPAGQRTGGQFAPTPRPAQPPPSGLSLSDNDETHNEKMDRLLWESAYAYGWLGADAEDLHPARRHEHAETFADAVWSAREAAVDEAVQEGADAGANDDPAWPDRHEDCGGATMGFEHADGCGTVCLGCCQIVEDKLGVWDSEQWGSSPPFDSRVADYADQLMSQRRQGHATCMCHRRMQGVICGYHELGSVDGGEYEQAAHAYWLAADGYAVDPDKWEAQVEAAGEYATRHVNTLRWQQAHDLAEHRRGQPAAQST